MSSHKPDYDPRYLAGILFFNARDFFEAHEVWEDLWAESAAPERRFYQALIQAAVALFHFGNGNLRGAARLYHSSSDYMKPYAPNYQGLDVAGFAEQMKVCFAGITDAWDPSLTLPARTPLVLNPDLIPTIRLDPEPASWPDPEEFLRKEAAGHE